MSHTAAVNIGLFFGIPFEQGCRTRLQLARVIRVPANLGRKPAAYLPYAREFSRALEAFVAEHPYQFFNFYDMWA